MEPYYQAGGVTIYHGDGREVIPELEGLGLILTDPPYGINHPTDYGRRGRSNMATARDYPPVIGDAEPFSPAWLLELGLPLVLWGANHYADKLPSSSGWLVWDKRRPHTLDQSTAELAWTDHIKGVRVFRYLWHGAIREGKEELIHPTQKPAALMEWSLTQRWTPEEGIVADPYMGGGSTLVAAKRLGRQAVGVELSEAYCELAAKRLERTRPREVTPEGSARVGLPTGWSLGA